MANQPMKWNALNVQTNQNIAGEIKCREMRFDNEIAPMQMQMQT